MTPINISNPHNLITAPQDPQGRYGIRVSLDPSDPFQRLLSTPWETFHWYAEAIIRDEALRDMSSRHQFSRMGDAPTTRYEPVERQALD